MAAGTHIDEETLYRGVVVDAYGPEDVDLLEYLRRQSIADDGRTPQRDAPAVTDGGQSRANCWCADKDLPCFEHFREGSA